MRGFAMGFRTGWDIGDKFGDNLRRRQIEGDLAELGREADVTQGSGLRIVSPEGQEFTAVLPAGADLGAIRQQYEGAGYQATPMEAPQYAARSGSRDIGVYGDETQARRGASDYNYGLNLRRAEAYERRGDLEGGRGLRRDAQMLRAADQQAETFTRSRRDWDRQDAFDADLSALTKAAREAGKSLDSPDVIAKALDLRVQHKLIDPHVAAQTKMQLGKLSAEGTHTSLKLAFAGFPDQAAEHYNLFGNNRADPASLVLQQGMREIQNPYTGKMEKVPDTFIAPIVNGKQMPPIWRSDYENQTLQLRQMAGMGSYRQDQLATRRELAAMRSAGDLRQRKFDEAEQMATEIPGYRRGLEAARAAGSKEAEAIYASGLEEREMRASLYGIKSPHRSEGKPSRFMVMRDELDKAFSKDGMTPEEYNDRLANIAALERQDYLRAGGKLEIPEGMQPRQPAERGNPWLGKPTRTGPLWDGSMPDMLPVRDWRRDLPPAR